MRACILLTFLFLILNSSDGLAQCAAKEGPGTPIGEITLAKQTTSGAYDIDTLVRSYYNRLAAIYQVNCKVFYLPNVDNSYANNYPGDRNIYLGVKLIKAVMSRPEGRRMVAFLVAHELAHIYQFSDDKNKFYADNNNKNSFELQADYLAGYALFKAGIIKKEFYSVLYSTVESQGDFSFNNIRHHGTPLQRSNAAAMGIGVGNLTFFSNVYENSFYYINQGTLIKPFNDKQIMGEFYLFPAGRKLFPGHDKIFYNEANEIFFKEGDEYCKIGAGYKMSDRNSTFLFDVNYNEDTIRLKKNDNGKLLDLNGRIIGEFIFYTGFFQVQWMKLNCHTKIMEEVPESSKYPPSIALSGQDLFLASVNDDGHIILRKSTNEGAFKTICKLDYNNIGSAPVLVIEKGHFYLTWLDTEGHPVVAVSINGYDWISSRVSNVINVANPSAVWFNGELVVVITDLSAHLALLRKGYDGGFNKTVLNYQSAKAPCAYVYNGDLYIGGIDMQSGQPFMIQSADGKEFFNRQGIPFVELNNPFRVGIHPVPEVDLTEQWYCFRSNDGNHVRISTQFSGPNFLDAGGSCLDYPVIAFPYIAWTEMTGDKRVKVAKVVINAAQ